MSLKFDAKRFVINSHRGAFKEGLLENTVPAFKQSVKEGANMLECDIRITKDNHIVLIHNNTIDHICGFATTTPPIEEFNELSNGPINTHTLSYLQALKYDNNAQIMSLPEFLELLKEIKVGAQIELKQGGYEDLILKNIQDANIDYESCLGPIVCTSFNWPAILRMIKKAKNFNIPLYTHDGGIGLAFGLQGIPLGSFIGKWVLRQCHKKNIWGFCTYYKNLPIKRLAYAHEQGVKFCPRVPDKEDLINAYIDAGVDGFETDNVPLIRECAKKKGIELLDL
jgi:glycerophosphoryl diester phosphodiesterase